MDAHDHGDADRHRTDPLEPTGDSERDAERAATVGGFTGAVLGARGGPVGAGIGALVGGSTGYAVGYALSELESTDRDGSGDDADDGLGESPADAAESDDGPVTIDVESEGAADGEPADSDPADEGEGVDHEAGGDDSEAGGDDPDGESGDGADHGTSDEHAD